MFIWFKDRDRFSCTTTFNQRQANTFTQLLVRKNNDERKILLHDIGEVDFDHVQQAYDAVKYQLLRETNGDTKDQPSEVIDDIIEPIYLIIWLDRPMNQAKNKLKIIGNKDEKLLPKVLYVYYYLLMDNELILVRDLKKISFLFIEIFYE